MSVIRAFFKSNALRWTLVSLGGVLLLAIGTLYAASEWVLTTTYDAPQITLRTQQPGSAERGERLAAVVGCVGCHGTHGKILFEAPLVGRIVTPDLARVAPNYSDTELVTVIRTGIKRDHTSAVVMPANALSSMADEDIADVIAWLRTLKPDSDTIKEQTSAGPMGRVAILTGLLRLSALVPRDPNPPVSAPTEPTAHGEYLVKVVCSDCHQLDAPHEVKPGVTAPPLREMVQAYDLAQLTRLLHTGKAIGDRELNTMSDVVREGMYNLTDDEIVSIHTYLNGSSSNTTAAN